MMSSVFSKSKEKRPRSSSNESNNSFVKNVTSRVSGLLPATIVKWFSSPSSSNANGSTATADATDSSTEDEAPETSVIQPPAKRMRFSPPGNFNNFNSTDVNCTTSNESTEQNNSTLYITIQSPPGRSTFRRVTNYISTPVRPTHEDTKLERTDRESSYKSQHTVSAIGQSIANKRKSIVDLPLHKDDDEPCAKTKSHTKKNRKPCFKPALLCSSPFYAGNTMYGGAASSYINEPNIRQRKVALVKEAKDDDSSSGMSHSARRIMDLLEHYSSPLMEAKRIPQYVKSTTKDSVLNTSNADSSTASKVISYKTQELHVPSIASILRLKQRSRLMDTTSAARQIIASHSSSEYRPYVKDNPKKDQVETDPGTSKGTTKVKARLTRTNRGEDPLQVVEPVQLPTAVLKIDSDNLPKFSFGIPAVSEQGSSSTSTTATNTLPTFKMINATPTQATKADSNPSDNMFKFSSPVTIANESQPSKTPPKFAFGSPERGVDKQKTEENKEVVISSSKESESNRSTPDWKCNDCWIFNKAEAEKCVCCGSKQPSKDSDKQAKCTICKLADSKPNADKCVNCEKMQEINLPAVSCTPIVKPADGTKWKCDECWVNNDNNAEMCVSCGSANPKKKSTQQTVAENNAKACDKQWKCEDCWISNKSNAEKCLACGGAKPGTKIIEQPKTTVTSDLSKQPDQKFAEIVKSQKTESKWECSSCLVRNDNDKSQCVCCGMEKESKGTTNKSFNFGMNTNTTFKFGIFPAAQESSLPKPPESDNSIVMLDESETNNNTLAKTPTFTFAINNKNSENKADSLNEKADEVPKPTFSFGIPKQTPIIPAVPAVKEIKIKSFSAEKEKPQEVPKISFGSTESQQLKLFSGFFGSPLTSRPSALSSHIEKPMGSLASLIKTSPTKEKEKPSNPLALQIMSSSENSSKQQTTFTFGSGLKSSGTLFSKPASTTPSANISFGSSIPSTTATSTSPTMSFFQNPETNTSASISLFKKSEPTSTASLTLFKKSDTITTTVATSSNAPAPIFSFGTNVLNAVPIVPSVAEKPKFNFSFGNNNNQDPSPFKSAFGSSSDGASNKFTFSVGNALGVGNNPLGGNNNLITGNGPSHGNGLTGSILSGGNGLPKMNPMRTGNESVANVLSGGLQSSNILSSGPSSSIFGAPAQKENVWSTNNNNNTINAGSMFPSSTTSNSMQKPTTFTFGSGNFQPSSSTPAFGNNVQPPPPMFGMPSQNTPSTPSLFASPTQNQPGPNLFGSPHASSTQSPSLGMFGTPNVGATPSFGTPNPSIPSFEAPSLTPAPAPAFNFGGQQTTGIFGFGQQQSQPAQQPGMYSFGAAPSPNPQVQFNMGSAPNTAVRRVRKAVRRNPQR